MKYTIEGFSQSYASTLRDDKTHIDCTDLVILRWFIDFQATGKMEFFDVGCDRFFWVNYNSLLEDMPILSLSKRALYDRLQKMVKFGILKHYHSKLGGSFSYYCVGPNYCNLVSLPSEENFRPSEENFRPSEENFTPLGSKLPNPRKQTSEPLGSKLPNKDHSTNNPSSKDPSSKDRLKRKRFTPPTVDDVRQYCYERGNNIDAEAFVDYYTARGWKYGQGRPVVDWKAAVRTWEKRERRNGYDPGMYAETEGSL